MNLNDPEMQKQLKRWEQVCHGGIHVFGPSLSCQCGLFTDLAITNVGSTCTVMASAEFQPARGWADYDRQFLKDLGISPLE